MQECFTVSNLLLISNDLVHNLGQVETYCETITHQNISGAVLAHCSIGELKPILNMNFGDWELFQVISSSNFFEYNCILLTRLAKY